MQQWGWVGSAAAPSCAVGTGVLDSVLLLPPCTPGLWLQVKGKWHSHAGKICGALASEGGKGSLSQFLLKGWGRGSCAVMQVGGGGGVSGCRGCSGSPWLHVGKCKGWPRSSQPARVGAGFPTGLLEHL